MADYKKDIMMVYHIPVDGLSQQRAEQIMYDFMKLYKTGDFYREMFIPYTGGNEQIVKIEVIDLKNNKTADVRVKLEEIDDNLMKYFEPDRWTRKQKLGRIL